MSRKAIWVWFVAGGIAYFAVKIWLGLDTWQNAASLIFDAAWWSGFALGAHWWSQRYLYTATR